MIQKELTVENTLGIHARPASSIVQASAKFKSSITLHKDGIGADAKSIMSVMMLAAASQSKVLLKVNGPDEKDAMAAIEDLFHRRFGEE